LTIWRITAKGAMAHRRRYSLTALAVLLGVAFIVGTLVLTDTMNASFDGLYRQIYQGTSAVIRARQPFSPGVTFASQRDRLDASLAATVRTVPGVKAVSLGIDGYAQLVGRNGKAIGKPGNGPPTLGQAWTDIAALNPLRILPGGHPPRASSEVVIDKHSAAVGHFRVGDKVVVLTQQPPATYTISGIATWGGADSPLGASITAFDPVTAARVLGRPGKADSINVEAARGVSQEQLVSRLRGVIRNPKIEVLSGQAVTAEGQKAIHQALGFINAFLLVFAFIALFVGSFIIFNTFSIVVAQRVRELALLRAVGASRVQVLASVLGESLVIGVLAAVAGVAAGTVLAIGLKAGLAALGFSLPATGLVVSLRTVLTGLGVGILITLVSAVWPARRAASVPPVTAMQNMSAEPRRRATGKLAQQNAMRNPARTAATAAALMVGVSLVSVMTIVASSTKDSVNAIIDSAMRADYVIGSGAVPGGPGGGFSPRLERSLSALPQVSTATGIRSGVAQAYGTTATVTATDPAKAAALFSIGVLQGRLAGMTASGIAVSSQIAASHQLRIGSPVSLTFPATGRKTYRVQVIYKVRELAGDYVLPLAAATANFPQALDSQIFVKLAPGVTASTGRHAIGRVLAAYPNATLTDQAQYKQQQAQQVNQLLNLVYGLLALALIIALIGIANTLALSNYERIRELGLLRAVGLTRGQLRSMVRLESLIISLLGAFEGLGLGIVLGWAIVAALRPQGITHLVFPVAQLLVLAAAAGLAGLLAAIAPGRHAARLDVLRAVTSD
jgi:putative ABC transport system permease protein